MSDTYFLSSRSTTPARQKPLLLLTALLLLTVGVAACAPTARASAVSTAVWPAQANAAAVTAAAATSLEQAASKAGDTGRRVAMSLIGLAFAIAAIVLSFRRDFKEAAGVFAVGIVAVLLATPAGVALLRATVTSLFGSA